MNHLSVTIHQVSHYYPFGMPMDCATTNAYQRWLFGDKEFDRAHGLDLYDQTARQYDPQTGRFRSPDPFAEKYHTLSPYFFCAANPLLFIDPSGRYFVFSDDASDEFKSMFNKARKILSDAGASENIDFLDKSNVKITIEEGDMKRVVEGSERSTAIKLGKIDADERRENHMEVLITSR